MSTTLRHYARTHRAPAFPLVALRDHVRAHGPPDAAGIVALAGDLGLPPATVRAALSYYADLHARPGAARVCHGTSCELAGAAGVRSRLAARATCETVYCLGYCDRSPAVMDAGDRIVLHARGDELGIAGGDVDGGSAVGGGAVGAGVVGNGPPGPAEHVFSDAHATPDPPPPDIRRLVDPPIVTARVGRGDHAALGVAREAGVYAALAEALRGTPAAVLDAVARSGEQGRGGAAYPTGEKWRTCAATPADRRYVVANGDEGDPGAFVDRVLMEMDPHALLEGMALCAFAVGASEGIVFVRSEYPRAIRRVAAAIAEARAAGILGPGVLGSGFAFDVTVFPALGSYVCGEETALLGALEGFRGEVSLRPPYPAVRGLHGRPTVINNVETLVNVPWIVRRGPGAYRAVGTARSPGTKAICLNHGFARPGIAEVAFGTPLRAVIEDVAGGGREGRRLDAVILGGPMGTILAPGEWDVPICYGAMADRGIQLGHGGLVALPEGTDYLALLVHWLTFMQDESCGKCVPCRLGSRRALDTARRLAEPGVPPGEKDELVTALHRLCGVMADGSLCAFGQLMPGPVRWILANRLNRSGTSRA